MKGRRLALALAIIGATVGASGATRDPLAWDAPQVVPIARLGYLAGEAGLSLSTARRALRDLEAAGVVQTIERRAPRGDRMPNVYQLGEAYVVAPRERSPGVPSEGASTWRAIADAHAAAWRRRYGVAGLPPQVVRADERRSIVAALDALRVAGALTTAEAARRILDAWLAKDGSRGWLAERAHPLGQLARDATGIVRDLLAEQRRSKRPRPAPPVSPRGAPVRGAPAAPYLAKLGSLGVKLARLAGVGAGVEQLNHASDGAVRPPVIAGGSVDLPVPDETSDRWQIGAGVERRTDAAPPQVVRVDGPEPSTSSEASDRVAHVGAGEAPIGREPARAPDGAKERAGVIPAPVEPIAEQPGQLTSDRHVALAAPLAMDAQGAAHRQGGPVCIEVAQVEPDDFASPKPAEVAERNEQPIARADRVVAGGAEKPPKLGQLDMAPGGGRVAAHRGPVEDRPEPQAVDAAESSGREQDAAQRREHTSERRRSVPAREYQASGGDVAGVERRPGGRGESEALKERAPKRERLGLHTSSAVRPEVGEVQASGFVSAFLRRFGRRGSGPSGPGSSEGSG